MDARQETGHQNWGLAQQKKNKTFNQQRQSDYTINYLGKYNNIHNCNTSATNCTLFYPIGIFRFDFLQDQLLNKEHN